MAIDFSKNDLVVRAGLSAQELTISQGVEDTPAIFVSNLNRVGINTENPNERLTVIGNISASGLILAANVGWEKRFDFVMGDPNVSYSGNAPRGSLESLSAWDVTKFTYTDTGLIAEDDYAYGIAWTDRYTASYQPNPI